MAAPPGIPPSVAKLPLEDLQKLTVECLKKLKVGAAAGGRRSAGCSLPCCSQHLPASQQVLLWSWDLAHAP